MSPLLWTLFLPLLGSCALLFIPAWNHKLIRSIGLFFSLATFLVSLLLWIEFDNASARFQFVNDFALIRHTYRSSIGYITSQSDVLHNVVVSGGDYTTLGFVVGVDGVSIFFCNIDLFLNSRLLIGRMDLSKGVR